MARTIFRRVSELNICREISPATNPSLSKDQALVDPNREPKSTDIRCGRNATIAWNKPKTATIKAGDTVGFACGEPSLGVSGGLIIQLTNSDIGIGRRYSTHVPSRICISLAFEITDR